MKLWSCLALVILAGCGYVGNPQAPTLDLPQRVTDVKVVEYGDQIVAEFTIPLLTTEGLPLKSVRSVDLRIGVAPQPFSDAAWAASAKAIPLPGGMGPLEAKTPAAEWVGKEVVVRVRATGPKGKTSDWSSALNFSVQPPLPTPADLELQNARVGLYITWKYPKGKAEKFRVFLKTDDGEPQFLGATPELNYNFPGAEFGTRYQYFVQAVTGELQQSETAASAPITFADIFKPGVPEGLTVTLGGASIELSWQRNTDPGFRGYNVFRSVNGGAPEKVASLIIAPAYSDSKIEAGKEYSYAISAVGTNGLESAQSAPSGITAQ